MPKRATRRASAAADRKAREQGLAWLKLAAAAAVVVAVAVIYAKVSASHLELDEATLCPANPVSVTVLLVDVTDPMNLAQRQDFANQLVQLRNSIPRYGKLVVTKVDSTSGQLLTPIITKCNPGTGSDESEATGNPKALQKQYEEGFVQPLNEAFAGLSDASSSEQSPIMESVQSVALTELQNPQVLSKTRRLIVVSDLLQNTGELSFYKSIPSADKLIASAQFRRVRTDLSKVEVELWMLERTDAALTQPRALANLWERIIGSQKGDLTRIYNVSG